jgi:hypothetical protein
MSPPRWVGPDGRELPTRPCPRCGAPTPILRLAVEDVQRNGWRCFAPATLVHWCGHGGEVIPVPDADGVCDLVPVIGEAT